MRTLLLLPLLGAAACVAPPDDDLVERPLPAAEAPAAPADVAVDTPPMIEVAAAATSVSSNLALAPDGRPRIVVQADETHLDLVTRTDAGWVRERLPFLCNIDNWTLTDPTRSQNKHLAVDAAGALHVICARRAPLPGSGRGPMTSLVYATNASGTWRDEVVAPAELIRYNGTVVGYYERGRPAQLGLDAAGNVHLSYFEVQWDSSPWNPLSRLIYRRGRAGAWEAPRVGAQGTGYIRAELSLVVEPSGTPHVLTHKWIMGDTAGAFIVETPAGTGWKTNTLWTVRNPNTASVASPAVAVDSVGRRHGVWYDFSGYEGFREGGNLVHAAARDSDPRTYTFVDGAYHDRGNVGADPAIAIGPDDALHVTYYSAARDALAYAIRRDGEWSFREIDRLGVGSDSSLAVDAGGVVHVLYFDVDFTRYKYARIEP